MGNLSCRHLRWCRLTFLRRQEILPDQVAFHLYGVPVVLRLIRHLNADFAQPEPLQGVERLPSSCLGPQFERHVIHTYSYAELAQTRHAQPNFHEHLFVILVRLILKMSAAGGKRGAVVRALDLEAANSRQGSRCNLVHAGAKSVHAVEAKGMVSIEEPRGTVGDSRMNAQRCYGSGGQLIDRDARLQGPDTPRKV